jgi:hypothetical protein
MTEHVSGNRQAVFADRYVTAFENASAITLPPHLLQLAARGP